MIIFAYFLEISTFSASVLPRISSPIFSCIDQDTSLSKTAFDHSLYFAKIRTFLFTIKYYLPG